MKRRNIKVQDEPDMLWPPHLVSELREWLSARYPDKDQKLLGVVAEQIDGLVRDMLRADRRVKVKTLRSSGDSVLSVTAQGASIVEALRRIDNAIKTGKKHLYAKAFAEAPADAIALIEQAKGEVGWSGARIPGIAGFPIPAPAEVERHLASAFALVSVAGRPARWRRDRTLESIAYWYERITGERPRQSNKSSTSRRSGPFPDFLDDVERFYAERLPDDFKLKFGAQNSGRVTGKISGR